MGYLTYAVTSLFKYSQKSNTVQGMARHNRRISNETRARMSKAHKGKRNGMYGKHHTPEAKAKIQISMIRYWKGIPL